MGKIFISHSSANNAEALAIHDWLAEAGWGDVFLDLDPRRGLVAGDRWQAALKAAAESCELILVLISPDWAKSKWCLAEFLLAKQMNKQILGVVVKPTPLADLPVELTAEWQLVDLSAPDPGWSTTIAPPRYEPETVVKFSGTGLARLRSGLEKAGLDATTFHWPPAGEPDRAPYRGLLPLEAEDAGIFFGREGAIILTLDALRGLSAAAAPRFATILGASGAGKSSFLRAGLLPRLGRDSRHFCLLPIIRPGRAALTGEHGFAAMLETALKARNVTLNRADIRDAVAAGADAVRPLLKRLVDSVDAGDAPSGVTPVLVLAVDQAEELLGADNAEAGAFLTLLADLGKSDDPAVLVIFTVRSDSFDQLQSRPELAATQPHHLVDLPPVPAGSFGDIIRGPARRVSDAGRKLVIEETLVDALLADIEVGGAKDALPLLAFTLERLFADYGADGDLQLAEYEKLGRIRGAIEAAVERAMQKADANPAIPRDRAARLALLRRGLIPWLAGIDPVTGSPRRRVARLAEVPEEARPLIELMVEERLLSTDVDRATNERTIEPAHEALLRQWGALDGWLAEDTADLSLIEALRRAATEWEASARGAEFLVHKGARLTTAEQLSNAEKFAAYLTSTDRAYLGAARSAENAARARARSLRVGLGIAATVVGAVVVAGLTAGWFIWQAGEAARREAAANFLMSQSEAALRSGRPEVAAKAALAADALISTAASRNAVYESTMEIDTHLERIADVAVSSLGVVYVDPTHLLVLGRDGSTSTLDLAARTQPAPSSVAKPAGAASAEAVQPLTLAPGIGGDVRAFNSDGSITTLDGAVVAAAPAPEFAGFRADASRNGDLAIFEGLAGDVLVRRCSALPCTDIRIDNASARVAIAADGSGYAVASETDGISIYEASGDLLRTFHLPDSDNYQGEINSVSWSPAASVVAVAPERGLLLYNSADPQAQPRPAGPDERVTLMRWSPDGQTLAVACEHNDICLYGSDGSPHARFHGHRDAISFIDWSPDGTGLASTSADGTVRVWNVTESHDVRFAFDTGQDGPGYSTIAYDRQRGVLAASAWGLMWVWQKAGKPRLINPPVYAGYGNADEVSSFGFLADGRMVAVDQDDLVSVWNLADPSIYGVEDAPAVLSVPIENAQFSRVAITSGATRAVVPLTDGRLLTLQGNDLHPAFLPPEGALTPWGVAAAPAADEVFVSYSDGSIRRRNLADPAKSTLVFDAAKPVCGAGPTSDNNGARSLDVSADGRWLTATRTDSTIVVHNLGDPSAPVCLSLPSGDSSVVAFSPDSTRLAILTATNRLSVFDLAHPTEALILDAPAVPAAATAIVPPCCRRDATWLLWLDDRTLAVSTNANFIEALSVDPAAWRTRVDSLRFAQ